MLSVLCVSQNIVYQQKETSLLLLHKLWSRRAENRKKKKKKALLCNYEDGAGNISLNFNYGQM